MSGAIGAASIQPNQIPVAAPRSMTQLHLEARPCKRRTDAPNDQGRDAMEKTRSLLDNVGLHPLVGFGMAALDAMLFGQEAATLGVTWPISVVVAVVFAGASVLIQRKGYGDDWLLAIGKGMVVGLLTAIPTAILAIVPIAGGVAGAWSMAFGRKQLPQD